MVREARRQVMRGKLAAAECAASKMLRVDLQTAAAERDVEARETLTGERGG